MKATVSRLGLVMLDTRFPRPHGDIGHAGSFAVPVLRQVVRQAVPSAVVTRAEALRASGLRAAFEQAVGQLVADGAAAVTTSCGFLVLLQRELQAAAGGVPVVASSLLQLPALLAHEPRVGVLTVSATNLGPEHLRAAGVPEARLADVVVEGMPPDGEFAGTLLHDRPAWDEARAHAEVLAAALALRRRAPDLATVVLECTNMPPCAGAIAQATGWRVVSIFDDPALAPLVAPGVRA